mmetsp:Transcript_28429/g.45660  ORF Transcript_28429/g.45660 Transcript_28429/m.45660 type:complete len:80 (+) Transcript_28429:73-312(+)
MLLQLATVIPRAESEYDSAECQVHSFRRESLATRQGVLPLLLGAAGHNQEASMSQSYAQLARPSTVLAEIKVTLSSEGD